MSDVELPGQEGDDEPLPQSADQPTVDAASPKGYRKQERKVDQDKRASEEFWRGLIATPVGRREMWQLLAGSMGAHAFSAEFASGPAGVPDPLATWYKRGEQDFGLRLYQKLLLLDSHAIALMHKEHDPRFATPSPRRK